MTKEEKINLRNFIWYVKFQCRHGVPLEKVMKNLGYVKLEERNADT